MTTNEAIRNVYTPNDIASYTMDVVAARKAQKADALLTGVASLDRAMRPVLPGEVVFVMAFTAHGKTSFMQFWARQIVKQLQARESQNEMVVYVTWETLVEELGLYDLCGMTGIDDSMAWYGDIDDAQVQKLKIAAMKRAAMPLWVQGYSIKRRRQEGGMTMAQVSGGLATIENLYKLKPAAVFLDYLQDIDTDDPRVDRRIQILRNVGAIRQLSRDCACPVIVGCQAGRQVLGRDVKLPEIGDGQETSKIEQSADKVMALWYPCKTERDGAEVLGEVVTEELMIMGIRKQRHAPSGQVFPVRFDAARNTFTSWEA